MQIGAPINQGTPRDEHRSSRKVRRCFGPGLGLVEMLFLGSAGHGGLGVSVRSLSPILRRVWANTEKLDSGDLLTKQLRPEIAAITQLYLLRLRSHRRLRYNPDEQQAQVY